MKNILPLIILHFCKFWSGIAHLRQLSLVYNQVLKIWYEVLKRVHTVLAYI